MTRPVKTDFPETDCRYQYLEKLDLSYIENYMCSAHYALPQWSSSDARFAIQLYKRFLWLIVRYGANQIIVPTKEIDEVWHNHILHTKRYTQDCQAVAGQYIHHMPSDFSDQDMASLSRNFEITQELYYKEFHEKLPFYEYHAS
jgi:hypothetical protein